jgi:hypothetical protein
MQLTDYRIQELGRLATGDLFSKKVEVERFELAALILEVEEYRERLSRIEKVESAILMAKMFDAEAADF